MPGVLVRHAQKRGSGSRSALGTHASVRARRRLGRERRSSRPTAWWLSLPSRALLLASTRATRRAAPSRRAKPRGAADAPPRLTVVKDDSPAGCGCAVLVRSRLDESGAQVPHESDTGRSEFGGGFGGGRLFGARIRAAPSGRFAHVLNAIAEAGLEPALPCGKRILNPPRLPFRHSAVVEQVAEAGGILDEVRDGASPFVRRGRPVGRRERFSRRRGPRARRSSSLGLATGVAVGGVVRDLLADVGQARRAREAERGPAAGGRVGSRQGREIFSFAPSGGPTGVGRLER